MTPNEEGDTTHIHQKAYAPSMLMSDPPRQKWICTVCGAEGIDVIGAVPWNEYEAARKRFRKEPS